MGVPRWAVTAVAAALAVGGASVQNIALVHWTKGPDNKSTGGLPAPGISAFAVLFIGCLYFLLTFLVLIGVRALLAGGDWKMFLPSHDAAENRLFVWPRRGGTAAQQLVLIGALGTLNSLMNVYASPPDRTPPLVQTVLLNAGVLFAVPLSKLFLGDKKVYCALAPAGSAALIVISVVVSLLPSIISGAAPPPAGRLLQGAPAADDNSGDDGRGDPGRGLNPVLWSLVYLFSNLPWAADCIVEQAFLLKAGAHDDDMPAGELATVTLRLLFWQALWQVVFIWAIFYVDLLPWFGFSHSFADFRANTVQGIVCSVLGQRASAEASGLAAETCAPWAPVWAVAMAAGYVISYIADAVLIRVSASLSMLNYVLIAAATSAVYQIPGVNPAPENTPIWSVAASVVLSAVGLIFWTRWENSYDAEHAYTVMTPKRRATELAGDAGAIDEDDEDDEAGVAVFQGRLRGGSGGGGGGGAKAAASRAGAWSSHGAAMVAPVVLRDGGMGVELQALSPQQSARAAAATAATTAAAATTARAAAATEGEVVGLLSGRSKGSRGSSNGGSSGAPSPRG